MTELGQLTVDAVGAQVDVFDQRVSPDFHLPALADEPLHADEHTLLTAQPDARRTEQTVTHLQLLGYLADSTVVSAEDLAEALAQWDAEHLAAVRAGDLAIELPGENITLTAPLTADTRHRLLKAEATFEGEVALRRMPAEGERSLVSRLALLRLIAYGLARVTGVNTTAEVDQFGTNAAFSASTADAALRAGRRTFFNDLSRPDLDLLNLLGNASASTDLFLAHHAGQRFLFRGPPTPAGDRSELEAIGPDAALTWHPRWVQHGDHWLLGDTDHLASTPELVEGVPGTALSDPTLRQQAQLPTNVVALELVQLRLWTLGYYHGALDGVWGDRTTEALRQFGETYAHRGLGDTDTYLREGRDGWRVLYLGRLFGYIVDQLDIPAESLTSDEVGKLAEQAAGRLDAQEWQHLDGRYRTFRDNIRRVVGTPTTQNGAFLMASENPDRKRYFGWRRIFVAIGEAVRGVVRGVADWLERAIRKVTDLLREGLGAAMEVLRYLWRKVRVAMRIARLAAQRLRCWLTGHAVATQEATHHAVTWSQFDFDTLAYVSPGCPAHVVALHTERLGWMSRSLAFMCELATAVLRALALGAVGGWLKLAFDLYRQAGELLRNPDYMGLFSDDLLERGVT